MIDLSSGSVKSAAIVLLFRYLMCWDVLGGEGKEGRGKREEGGTDY